MNTPSFKSLKLGGEDITILNEQVCNVLASNNSIKELSLARADIGDTEIKLLEYVLKGNNASLNCRWMNAILAMGQQ